MTRPGVALLAALLLSACGGGGGGGGSTDAGEPTPGDENGASAPNIIIVVLDDWGWKDFGFRNPGFDTPNIDAIARRGFVFDNAFLTTSSCSPSRASILMGRYPTDTGAPNLHDPVPDGFTSIPEVLHGAGYYTESVGKWHLGPEFGKRFDRVRDTRDVGAPELWPEILRQRPRGKPFFMWLASFDPHVPHEVPPEFQVHDPDSVLLPDYLVDTPASREAYAGYMNALHRVDHYLGLLLDELADEGLLGSTWLFLLADNGAPTPFAKTTLYDTGIKTPLLVLGPGVQGSYSGLVSSVDLAPTIADIAGVSVPPAFQGKSFLPAFRSPDYVHREYIFAEQNNHQTARSHTAVRSQRYLLIRNYFYDTICADEMSALWRDIVQANLGGTATVLQTLCYLPLPPVQFFRVEGEGYETVNRAGSPALVGQQARLEAALDEWESEHRTGACKDIACARRIEALRPPL